MKPVILWFRQDLRLADNPALLAAAASGAPVLPLFILDEETPGRWRPGAASRWWLHHSLAALNDALGGRLVLRRGNSTRIVKQLAQDAGASHVFWNRCYEPYAAAHASLLKTGLAKDGVAAQSFGASLLMEPWELKTAGGTPFRVFTPFWNALRRQSIPRPRAAPEGLRFVEDIAGGRLEDWALLPRDPDWASGFPWTPGEAAAQRTLRAFLKRITDYREARDVPAGEGTSHLSAPLHWGEISPRQVWHAVRDHGDSAGHEAFLRELGWREFCVQLLFHNPELPARPLDKRFAAFPWRQDDRAFRAWTRGMTGIPIVDAGMRQLWRTGWMHNRVRMIAASFLIKHLGISWQRGEEWFWDTLVDADLANNAAGWQWVAGSGADAAPFFRIFNPVLQGEKFDPGGGYVRNFVPELRDVPDKYVHKPWLAPAPPPDYPAPIMDLARGRDRALAAFRALKA